MAETPVSRYIPATRGFDPFAGLRGGSPFTDIDRLFNLFETVSPTRRTSSEALAATAPQAGMIVPRMDLHESETDIVLAAELPGLDEKDVELTIEDDVLTLSGEKKYEKRAEKDSAHFIERRYGAFRRAFTLPETVVREKITAKFDKGVLTVTLPKKALPEKKPRKITIS